MDNFVVSARKYRPRTFDDVVGQRAITDTLRRAIVTHKLAGAYLFCGPRGVGKTTCARIFAKAINCLHPGPGGEPCGECESCRAMDEQRSMNIQELNAAANNSVEDIRQIIDQVRTPPQVGHYKVIILDEVHMLSAAASNALLKTLEEPPSYVIFILATTEKQKILPTILSRCQTFDFNRMDDADIVSNLKNVAQHENIHFEDSALWLIAQKADGGMRDALSIFDQVTNYSGGDITQDSVLGCLNVPGYDVYFEMTDLLLAHRVGEGLLLLNDVLSRGFDGQTFIGGLASHFRNLLVSRDAATLPLLDASQNVKDRYATQARQCTVRFLYRAIKICDACSNGWRDSYNKRLSVELALIETAQAAEDDDGAGPRPSTTLKPLFRDTNPSVTASPRVSHPVTSNAAQDVQRDSVKASRTASSATTFPATADVSAQPTKVVVHTPRINLGGILGASKSTMAKEPRPEFNSSVASHSSPVLTKTEKVPSKENSTIGELNFTLQQAEKACESFAATLQADNPSVAARLQSAALTIENQTHVVMTVGNEMARKYVVSYVTKLQDHLCRELQNRFVTVEIRVAAPGQSGRVLSPRERFEKLVKENPAVSRMKNDLGLEVEYE